MAMKVDQTPAVTVSPSSTVSTSSPKISMFGKKSGFVIPKNKLSGSLVPVFRGSKKLEGGTSKEDTKQVHRKTKWGLDLTQDTTVRRGRALAYQTRVEQIMKQLKTGTVDGHGLDSQSPVQSGDDGSYNQQTKNQQQNFEQLELERREAIGEILRLNPNYQAPSDYKPVLKEARVPVPLKAYPGYNFFGVFLGPESSSQKRLEEETGAKIRVVGKKRDTLEEKEITSADKNDTQGAYQELYVHVSADTFEKVDAAVALIELLVTPVSGNANTAVTSSTSESGDKMRQADQNVTSGFLVPVASENQGLMQPMAGFTQSAPLQVQLQPYPSPWAPSGQLQAHIPAGSVPTSNPGLANPHFPPSAANFYNPPYSGARPLPSLGIQSASLSASPFGPGPQPSVHGLQYPMSQAFPPQSPSMPRIQAPQVYSSLSCQPTSSVPLQFSAPASVAIPAASDVRPTVNSMLRPMPSSLLGPASVVNPPSWIGASPTTAHARPSISVPTGPNLVPPLRRPPTDPHSIMPTKSDSRAAHVGSPATPVNHAVGPLLPPPPTQIIGSSLPSVSAPPPASLPAIASSTSMSQGPSPAYSQPPRSVNTQPQVLGHAPNISGSTMPLSRPMLVQAPGHILPPSHSPISGNLPSFSPIKPSMSTVQPMQSPKPKGPGTSDFTFQPLKMQPLASQTSLRPSNQPLPQNTHLGQQQSLIRPLATQTSPFQSAVSNPTTPLNMTGFLRPPTANPVGHAPSGPMVPLGPPPRHSAFQNPASLATQMRPVGFMSAPQGNNLVGFLPVRPGGSNAVRDMNIVIQNQQPGSNRTFPVASSQPGGNQIYDPFSPT